MHNNTNHETATAQGAEQALTHWDCLIHHEQYFHSRSISHKDFYELTDAEAIELAQSLRNATSFTAAEARGVLRKALADAIEIGKAVKHTYDCPNRCRCHIPSNAKRPSPITSGEDRS